MEAAFGHDFSRVRVFADASAAQTAAGAAARAVTIDRDIFFGAGEYEADARAGGALLAHELAHVVQHDQGAPPMLFRNAQDIRRIRRAIARAAGTLRVVAGNARFMTAQQRALLGSMLSVLDGFFPSGHGLVDSSGRITQPSRTHLVEIPIRNVGVASGTYQHELTMFLSEETPTQEAQYQRTARGGEIRIFVPNLLHTSDIELGQALTHELVHLFSDVQQNAELAAHRLRAAGTTLVGRSMTPAAPATPTGTPTGARPTAGTGPRRGSTPQTISVSLADASLHRDVAFSGQVIALATAYRPVVDFLNRQRTARGAAPLDVVPTSIAWANQSAEELLAYVYDQRVDAGMQLATGTGRARVAFTVPLNPLAFFHNYVGQHWITDPADRAAIRSAAAAPVLNAAGRSSEMTQVFNAITAWIDQ